MTPELLPERTPNGVPDAERRIEMPAALPVQARPEELQPLARRSIYRVLEIAGPPV